MILACCDDEPMRLIPDPSFRPCEPMAGEEIYPNGIFEFNITQLLSHIHSAGRFHAEPVPIGDIPSLGSAAGLSESAIAAADLSRPVILAEIAPDRYNLIDGQHRAARARREGVPSLPAYRIRCPDHVPFLTSTRAYQAYIEYWNSKVDDLSMDHRGRNRTGGKRRNPR